LNEENYLYKCENIAANNECGIHLDNEIIIKPYDNRLTIFGVSSEPSNKNNEATPFFSNYKITF
jgi:hypothetical protein